MIQVFIGYDGKETVAYHVLSHSIHARASQPVAITPLMLSQLKDSFHRERNALQSTDFAFSRFLVPYLCGFEGWSIFMDCDMLVLDDIVNLWNLRDDRYAVMCVKHDYTPKTGEKFLGQVQTAYEKKNWSSVILFNNSKCKTLTPEYVNSATGLELHRFRWLGDDNLIGEIPMKWNFLVGEYAKIPVKEISNLHYTLGGPYFSAYKDTDYAQEWFAERDRLMYADKDIRLVSANAPKQAILTPAERFQLAYAAFESGRTSEAESLCIDLTQSSPDFADGFNLLGMIAHQKNALKEAVVYFSRAADTDDKNPHYLLNLAMVHQALGNKEQMKKALDKTLELSPGYAKAFQLRIQVATAEEDYATAEKLLKNLMPIVPAAPQLLVLLITVLGKQEKYAQTLPYYEQLIRLNGTLAPQHMGGYALALQHTGSLYMAIEQFEQAISLGQKSAELMYNLAVAYDHTGNHAKAVDAFTQSIALDPTYDRAKAGLAMLQVKLGDLVADIDQYQLRSILSKEEDRAYPFTNWEGQSLAGKRILIWSEQGVGDIIMFAGFLPHILAQGAHCTLEMDPLMVPLMQQSFPELKIVPKGTSLDAELMQQKFDYQCAIGDLMRFCIRDYQPASHSTYIKPDPKKVAQLRQQYTKGTDHHLVGIAWNTINSITGGIRNIPLSQWIPIFDVPNCMFVSLQYLDHKEEVLALKHGFGKEIIIDSSIDPVRDKLNYAAQVKAMDCVISIQNATVHMAGSMGVDTTLMLSRSADWRWGTHATDSIFYDSVHILRQQQFGNWGPVITQAAQLLSERVKTVKYA